MTPAELQVVAESEPVVVRDPVLEQLLEKRCTTWEFIPELDLDRLDVAAGLANQARLESLNEEAVERYQADMERGDIFPPILVHRRKTKRGEKLVTLGGNHRTAAARKAKRRRLSAYVIEADGDAVLRLMYEDNRRHGLPPTDEERVMAAQHLMEIGDSIDDAAAAVGIGKAKLRQHLDVVEADRRAAGFDIAKWRSLPHSTRWRLGQVRYDRVFEKAAKLTVQANLRATEVFELVTLVNQPDNVEESLDRLAEHRKLLGNRVRGGDEMPGPATTARRRLISAMQEIRMLDPAEAAAGFETSDQRHVASDHIRATAKVLQAVLQRIDG
jgi:hypothetical protein